MLKIVDNVDLKELEKYGITYINNETFKSIHYNRAFWFREDKTITCGEIILSSDLDVLYDLIKDGLVEKVGE